MTENRKTLLINARIKLTDSEIEKAVSDLIESMEDRDHKKSELKRLRDRINGELKVIEERITSRAEAVRTGFEDREVEVYRVIDGRARKVFYYRTETDELVKSEPATDDDLQRKIDDEDAPTGGIEIAEETAAMFPGDASGTYAGTGETDGPETPIDPGFAGMKYLHLRANQKTTRCGIPLAELTDRQLTRHLYAENLCPDCRILHPRFRDDR